MVHGESGSETGLRDVTMVVGVRRIRVKTIRVSDNSGQRQFGSKQLGSATIRVKDNSGQGQFGSATIRVKDNSGQGQFGSRTHFFSLDLSI